MNAATVNGWELDKSLKQQDVENTNPSSSHVLALRALSWTSRQILRLILPTLTEIMLPIL